MLGHECLGQPPAHLASEQQELTPHEQQAARLREQQQLRATALRKKQWYDRQKLANYHDSEWDEENETRALEWETLAGTTSGNANSPARRL